MTMTGHINQPLDPVLRRRAAYMTLSEVLTGDVLTQAMWMIEERDQSADRLTFLGFVGVTAEIFGIDNHTVSILYTKLNKHLNLPSDELPPDPLPEMLRFRGIGQTGTQPASHSNPPQSQPASQSNTTSNTARSIFRAYDILGIVEKGLTQEIIFSIGQALGSEAKEHNCSTVILARDGRSSSSGLGQSLANGILSTGVNIIDLGLVPIPVLYFVAHHFEGKTGFMVTGGHHSSQHNGLKMVVAGEILAGEKIQRLKRRIDNTDFSLDQEGTLEENNTFIHEYIGMIAEYIHLRKPMKVVLNSGNGITGAVASQVMQAIGCEVLNIHEDVDENSPNHTFDPSHSENLVDLIATVRQRQADVGFAFDNEGTCIALVDCQGKIIRPDRQIMLLAKAILASQPNSQIIHDVQCTNHLTKLISRCGGRPLMCKSGLALMRAKLNATGAKLAGDKSGHIIFNDRWYGFDDALYAASRILEILSSDTRSSSEVFAELPESSDTAEFSVELNKDENQRIVEALIKETNFPGGKITDIDGLRIDYPEGWALIRAANTSPSLTFCFEADNEAALIEIQNQLKPLLLQIRPNLDLPF